MCSDFEIPVSGLGLGLRGEVLRTTTEEFGLRISELLIMTVDALRGCVASGFHLEEYLG